MPLHELVSLLLDAMRGVAAAHAQGVIHRDIKPDNIFLERQPDRSRCVPKVIDFGVSKLVGEGLSLTRSGATIGTPLYMSFEQLRGAKDVDGRTDVYSFGVILYEAMTGQPPFQADTLTELVVKITTTEPLRAKILRPDLPTSLDHLIHWAMAIDRDAAAADDARPDPRARAVRDRERLSRADDDRRRDHAQARRAGAGVRNATQRAAAARAVVARAAAKHAAQGARVHAGRRSTARQGAGLVVGQRDRATRGRGLRVRRPHAGRRTDAAGRPERRERATCGPAMPRMPRLRPWPP